MRTRTRGLDTFITVHTYSNRSLGIFLAFLGVVATWPLLYMYDLWFRLPPRTLQDWYPAAAVCVVLVAAGFLLAVASYKKITVDPTWIRVVDGPLHKPLTFHWDGKPAVRLQSVMSERNDRPQTTWIVKLVCNRYEYTIDERLGQQLESRGVAEAVAKALGCPLLEKNDQGVDVVIDARDLDMPFQERVKRYPALLGKPIQMPPNAGVNRSASEGHIDYSWGIVTASLLLSMVALGVVFFIVSAIPPRPEEGSYLEWAQKNHDYHLYIWTGATIALALLFSAGFRVRISLTPTDVHLSEALWGVPIVSRSIAVRDVEEVQVVHTVRGPLVQVLSDRQLIQFRAADADVAGWLAHEIRMHLAGEA